MYRASLCGLYYNQLIHTHTHTHTRTERHIYIYMHIYIYIYIYICIQGGAEPTDTFKMVIDKIWKQRKISETVYKYVQICYLLPTNYKLIL